MSMYTVAGMPVYSDYLMHGLGVGSGRGRPKGSRNGYISPGAAYMKDYTIVGQKAANDQIRAVGIDNGRSSSKRTPSITWRPSTLEESARARVGSRSNVKSSVNTSPKGSAADAGNAARTAARGKQAMENAITRNGRYNMHTDPYSTEQVHDEMEDGRTALDDYKDAAWGVVDDVVNTAKSIGQRIGQLFTSAIDTAKKGYRAARNWVAEKTRPARQWISTAYNTAKDAVTNAAKSVGRYLFGYDVDAGGMAGYNGTAHVDGLVDRGVNAVRGAARQAGQAVSNTAQQVGQTASNVAQQVGQGARDAVSSVRGYANGLAGNYDMTSDPYDTAYERAFEQGQGAGNWVNQNITQPVSNVAQQAGQAVRDAASSARGYVGGLTGNYDMRSDPYDAAYERAFEQGQAAGNWVSDNVVQPVTGAVNSGIDWANNNVVQPTAAAAQTVAEQQQRFNALWGSGAVQYALSNGANPFEVTQRISAVVTGQSAPSELLEWTRGFGVSQ